MVCAASPADTGEDRAAGCQRQLVDANAAFDRAFFARDVDTFIDFYTDDATIIYFNGTRPYTKEEARANSVALSTLDWTASFEAVSYTHLTLPTICSV